MLWVFDDVTSDTTIGRPVGLSSRQQGFYPGRPIPLNGTPSIPIELLDRQGIKAKIEKQRRAG
jgi:hypothetical protein